MTYVPDTKSPKHVADILHMINEASHDTQVALLVKHCKATPYDMLLSLNFNSNVKLDLPIGAPEIDIKNADVHPDLMSPLASQIGRLKACTVQQQRKKMDKERVFIQVLESIPSCDIPILIACKDKKLTELYPNITAELVKEVYPQWVK